VRPCGAACAPDGLTAEVLEGWDASTEDWSVEHMAGGLEKMHCIDVESPPPPPPRVCMSIHPEG